MFHIRPVIPHFILWTVLAPFFLLELRALEQLQQTLALQEGLRVHIVMAEVTAQRHRAPAHEVRYQFRTAGRSEAVEPMNTAGWGETWVPVNDAAWNEARTTGRIRVAYLPENPQANQPLGRAGSPIGDSAFSWLLFLALDLVWLTESAIMIRNYLRSQTAAERRQISTMRFWRTAESPAAHEQSRGHTNRGR